MTFSNHKIIQIILKRKSAKSETK
ncbi:hypothetical protein CCACVL1_10666, partial [Corchorus capsularis]